MSRDGLSVPRTRRSVATRSARPSSAKYSHVSGISTASAATSAFSVSSPSDGGVSIRMTSKSSRDRREDALQPMFAAVERDELDLGAGELSVGWNQRQAFDFVVGPTGAGASAVRA